MNIFVASWFFPPATSSEGIVTYKLLRNSRHHYDVFSSTSKQWGYQAVMHRCNENNICSYTIETDRIEDWVEASIQKFEELYPERMYSCIMTRSTPPESILIGQRIKQQHPEVKWIASLADPVANNPYELKGYVDDCKTLEPAQKAEVKAALRGTDEAQWKVWEQRPEVDIQTLFKLKRWENIVLQQADLIISPSGRQLRYIREDGVWNPKYMVLPHSFDPSFYSRQDQGNHEKVIFSFLGYSDALRSLEPVVRAVRLMKENGCPFLDRMEIRFIGNNPRNIYDMVLNYYLEDVVHFYPGVDYYKSLELMQESEWLIHVDAFFPGIEPGGSIFFAGKLADYMGANRPILALTGMGSPADEIVSKAGGLSVRPWDISELANTFEQILSGAVCPELNTAYTEQYSAPRVAQKFDFAAEILCGQTWKLRSDRWPVLPSAGSQEKLVTVCVPGYNVQRYLERCLRTLLDHEYVSETEVLIIDDGSKDHTAEIGKLFEAHYPGIVRLISKENGGHGSTINRAIQEGRGTYFMVVDGDDWIDSTQFEKLLTGIKSREFDADLISSNYHEVNMESGMCSPWKQSVEVEYFKKLSFEQLDVEQVYFTLASSLIRLSILKEMNQPLQEHTYYVDVEYILFPVPYLNTVMFADYYIYKYCRGNAEQSVHIPNMVKRYDHHERVMRRVLNYEKVSAMTEAQRAYYNAILRRLLYTHYALCVVYDTDKECGYTRGKEFDAFLSAEHPALAQWIGKNMRQVKVARRYNFCVNRVENSVELKVFRINTRIRQKMKRLLVQNRIIRHLVYNRFTMKISKHDFFVNGKGENIKQYLKGILSL